MFNTTPKEKAGTSRLNGKKAGESGEVMELDEWIQRNCVGPRNSNPEMLNDYVFKKHQEF